MTLMTTNTKLVQIMAVSTKAADAIPPGPWALSDEADDVAELYVVDPDDGSVIEHVAACSTHELDAYLLALPPVVGRQLAMDLLHLRGTVGALLDATAAQAHSAEVAILRKTLEQMVDPPAVRSTAEGVACPG